jgi:hypothetical protein
MISGSQFEVHDKVSEYLRGCLCLADLESWIWHLLGDLDESQDEGDRNIAGTIGSLISEYSYGDRTEESMRKELADAIRSFEKPKPAYIVFGKPPVSSPVASSIIDWQIWEFSQPA